MIKVKTSGLLLFIIFLNNCINAQDKSTVKFGKISTADFAVSKYNFDTSAAAIVIADVGSSEFEQNTKKFSIVFNHFKRIKILNKSGFDAATIEIPLFTDGHNIEVLSNLKAVTYNLENGKINEVKLDNKSIFTDKRNRNFVEQRFTFPALTEGSIIEYSYTVHSDFIFNLQPWVFQSIYPTLWSEYEVIIPELFYFVFLSQGYQPFYINKKSTTSFNYTPRVNGKDLLPEHLSADDYRFVMKDVPGLKQENFTTTINNHVAKVEFQLSQIKNPYSGYSENVMQNWNKLSEELMKNEYFGADIKSNYGWLDDELKSILNNTQGKLEKAEKIYKYLQANFICTNHSSLIGSDHIKTIFKNKNGNEADINLLLAAMLNHENIECDPVILSTRNHGYVNELYPLLSRFNYVICMTNIDGTNYYLDASLPMLGFGKLSDECNNGFARVINTENPTPVYFFADSSKEQKVTNVFIVNDEKNQSDISGNLQSRLGYYESYSLREKLANDKKNLIKEIKSTLNDEIEVQNLEIDSLKELELPITVHYDFTFKNAATVDIIYFNPIMDALFTENPLKSVNRIYPVEMPYTTDNVYILDMEIPKGYVINEIPKSEKISLNGTDGFFEYIVDNDETNIHLRSHIQIIKTTFTPEEYGSLRDFFAYTIKKQSEQIVFKKKK